MAFVFKRPGSPCWYAGFAGPDGKQVKKSTKLRVSLGTKKAAEIFAQKMEESAHRAGQGNFTQMRARAILSDLAEYTTGEALVFNTVETWLNTWVQGKVATKAPATVISYGKAVADFLAHLGPDRAKKGLELVNVRDFLTFRDKQIQQGKTPQTANNLLKKLRIPFNLARKQGLIPMNPAEAIETLPTEQIARGTFTTEQLAALVNVAEGDWQGVILAGIYTGQRLRDITNLPWSAVDLTTGTVLFIQGKTKRRVTLPMHEILAIWMRTQRTATVGKSTVFPTLAGKGTGGAHGLSRSFKLCMGKAGIQPERARVREAVKGRKGRDLFKLSFHSLRHTFNSIMANAGIAQEVRQELTGHASAAMNRVYTHHELSTFRGALNTLPSIEVRQKAD